LVASSALLLTACGGGGGDAAPGTSVQAASTITSANASDVAAQAYSTSDAINNQTSLGTSLVTGVSVETQTSSLIDSSLRQLYRALETKPANMAVGVSTTTTEACSGGGSNTITYEGANTDQVSNGDKLTISSNNCVEGSEKLNGALSFTISNISGTPSSSSAWSATLDIKYSNLALTENNVTITVDGDLTLGYGQTSTGAANFSVSGNSLKVSEMTGASTVTRTLSAFSNSGSVTGGLYTFRNNFTFAGNLPRLGNVSYTVKTLADFKQQAGSYPSQGVMTVTATDKTSLTFTVLNSTSVRLDIDKNGDGTNDESITKTWSELTSLM
jgi:hypothetical protein